MSMISEEARALQPTWAGVERLRALGEHAFAAECAKEVRRREGKAAWHQKHWTRRPLAMKQRY